MCRVYVPSVKNDDAVGRGVEPGVQLLAEGAEPLEARCQALGPARLPRVRLAGSTCRRQVEDLQADGGHFHFQSTGFLCLASFISGFSIFGMDVFFPAGGEIGWRVGKVFVLWIRGFVGFDGIEDFCCQIVNLF